MSAYESQARVLLHEALEAVERDAIQATERGVPTEPWTPEQLTAMALVYAVLAAAECSGRPGPTAPRRRSAAWTPRRMRRT